jgi:hypothetical protein
MKPIENAKAIAVNIANKFVTKSVFDMTDSELKTERENAKINALITVEEILLIDCKDMSEDCFNEHIDFWQQVKQEIQAL